MKAKVWLITGASRGLGLELVKAALEQGQYVAAAARKPSVVVDALGSRDGLFPVELDVTDPASIDSAVRAAIERFGTIDILINNAGYGIFGALEETTDEETRAIYDTNVFGPMNVIRAVLSAMRAQHSGRIVNISSMAGYAADPGGSLYDSSKAAVISLSDVLSCELSEFGIQCMAVCPGMVRTDFMDATSMKTPGHLMKDYEGSAARGALDYCLTHNHSQYGDPEKTARFICDVILSESMPKLLPVGKDAMKKLFKKCDSMKAQAEPYFERSSETAFPRK